MKRLIAAIGLVLTCCSGIEHHLDEAGAIARPRGLALRWVSAGGFDLLGFERRGPAGGTLTVYLEGDGRAWINPWQPASDPTPTDPIALRLAAADAAAPLLYLARPCQYRLRTSCDARLWTSARLSPEVVAAYQQAINDAISRTKSRQVRLVGYSGGGALATLIAERRHDVAMLVTVAANLDLQQWMQLQNLAPMPLSLDPATDTAALQHLPQIHLVGSGDPIVPPAVVQSFMGRLPAGNRARLVILPGFDHECCWADAWPRLVENLELTQ